MVVQAYRRSAPPSHTQGPREHSPGGRFEFLLSNSSAGLYASVSLLAQIPGTRPALNLTLSHFLDVHNGIPLLAVPFVKR